MARIGECSTQTAIGQGSFQDPCQVFRVIRTGQKTRITIFDNVGQTSGADTDHGRAAQLGLEQRHPEAFIDRGKNDNIRLSIFLGQIGLGHRVDKFDLSSKTVPPGLCPDLRAQRAFAN